MDQSNQQPSESRIRNFLGNLPWIGPWLVRAYNWGALILSWIKYVSGFSRSSHSGTLPHWAYITVLYSGIAATLVSAMIEYEILVAAYNSVREITSIPG